MQHTHQWDEADPARAYGAGIYPGRSQFACGELSPTVLPSSWGDMLEEMRTMKGTFRSKEGLGFQVTQAASPLGKKITPRQGLMRCPATLYTQLSELPGVVLPMPASTFPAGAQACYKLWLVPGAVPRQPFGCDHVDVGHVV